MPVARAPGARSRPPAPGPASRWGRLDGMSEPADRQAFAERMRLQLQARYRGVEVAIDGPAFALRLHGAGVDVSLPLAPLHQACLPRTRSGAAA